jgi:hypothetical protein
MMGDSASATAYTNTAAAVLATIYPHWNGYYVQESTNR